MRCSYLSCFSRCPEKSPLGVRVRVRIGGHNPSNLNPSNPNPRGKFPRGETFLFPRGSFPGGGGGNFPRTILVTCNCYFSHVCCCFICMHSCSLLVFLLSSLDGINRNPHTLRFFDPHAITLLHQAVYHKGSHFREKKSSREMSQGQSFAKINSREKNSEIARFISKTPQKVEYSHSRKLIPAKSL